MVVERLLLVDKDRALVRASSEAFEDFENVSAHEGDFFSMPADAMISPPSFSGIHAIHQALRTG